MMGFLVAGIVLAVLIFMLAIATVLLVLGSSRLDAIEEERIRVATDAEYDAFLEELQ